MSTLDPLSVADIGAVITATILDDVGAVDLTGATVTLLLKSGSTYIARTASIVSAVAGTVTYTTVAGDLPFPATWSLQWRAVWPSGADLFFPPVPHKLPVYSSLAEPA
jgi:hypothetical protein